MGNFSPWNWPSEAFILPQALLFIALCVIIIFGVIAPFADFLSPLNNLKHARERAEGNLKWPADRLTSAREDSAQRRDEVLTLMRKHIDPDTTPEQAAALTPEEARSLEWGDEAWVVNSRVRDVQYMHDAFEREQDAQKMYDETLAEHESLQKANFWSYRWQIFFHENWRSGLKRFVKTALTATAWFAASLYLIGLLTANYYSWVHNVREAVGQDYRVVGVRYWDSEVTIEQNGCEITFPVDVDSSTEYTFTGDGKADQDMVIIRGGVPVQPCLEHGIN